MCVCASFRVSFHSGYRCHSIALLNFKKKKAPQGPYQPTYIYKPGLADVQLREKWNN